MAQKHTPGPAKVSRSKLPSDGEYDFAVSCRNAPVVAEAFGRAADRDGSVLPAEANANLIAEAFTVAHETGLTPRELAEQRAELLAQLRIVTDDLEKVLRARGFRDDPKVLAARAIIAKAEGGVS